MQKTELTNSISLNCYDENEYLQKHKEINDILNKVFGGEYIENLNSEIFLTNKHVKIFTLKQKHTPISFAIFEIKNNIANLDIICTHNEYTKLGFATILLRGAILSLTSENIYTIRTIAKDEISQRLFDSLAKVEGVVAQQKEIDDGIEYIFLTEYVNKEKILIDIKELAM